MLRDVKDKPCKDCGVKYPYYVMQLDHRDPKRKCITPARIVSSGWSNKRILNEFDKCDVVCANCHAERTNKQQPRRGYHE